MSRISRSTVRPLNLSAGQIVAARRAFLTTAGLAGAAVIGSGMLGTSRTAMAGAKYTDPKKHQASVNDILNFALNLEYLEAEFYLRATTGSGLADSEVTGVVSKSPGKEPNIQGSAGAVTGGTTAVPFADPVIAQIANEIAADEHAHVLLLRSALGKKAVARPTIDLSTSFTNAAIAAGVITAGHTFDPFADDDSFLLGAFIFEDVGVTAYHGAAQYITNKDTLTTAAAILATEAYHAGAIRALLVTRGQTVPTDISIANAISALRASADSAAGGTGNDSDVTDAQGNALIAATDANGLAFARDLNEVLSIVYLGGAAGTGGGFFPNGLNGAVA